MPPARSVDTSADRYRMQVLDSGLRKNQLSWGKGLGQCAGNVTRAARGRLLSCRRVEFPEFPYHPDPRATGSVVVSDTSCVACGQSRGFVYAGPVYSQDELIDSLCPWCIADGSAAEKYDA